ncbi:MAG: PilZ domain-containing protein [Acidobacteriota bacterium]
MDRKPPSPPSILFAADGTSELWDLLATPVGFDLDHVRGFYASLAAVKSRRYDGIIVTLPLGDHPFGDFVQTVRSIACPCREAGLVVLTTSDRGEEANAYVGNGVNRVVSIDDPDRLRQAIVDVIDVGARTPIRLMTRLSIGIGSRDCQIRTYTQNVSRSGMLLDTSNMLDVGQQFDFSFRSPNGDHLVTGRAEVVRHTRDGREEISGIGVQFLQLDDRSAEALDELFDAAE